MAIKVVIKSAAAAPFNIAPEMWQALDRNKQIQSLARFLKCFFESALF
jgi:hypothetical protein